MGKQSRRNRKPSSMDLNEMQTKWSFYYWDETELSNDGESLKKCMDR